ncbi:hypothetical protein C8F01DRAFT_177394 [Mycena amicta]|nr:hypothetical protein C8F01DRAFT_177394 [Mycena amicta]
MASILGEAVSVSPECSDPDSGEGSDSTLEDLDLFPTWAQGYPLQRVEARRRDSSASSSSVSTNSDVVYDIDCEQLIDDLLAEDPFPMSETRNTVVVAPSSPDANDSMLIKRLHRSSPELLILLRLNQRELRQDPWNPAPHIICAVPRDQHVFICLQRLVEFNQPPLQNVTNYVDFFRQVLEGLCFLHEHCIASLGCRNLSSYMVDLGPATASNSESVESFDRTRYPVRYYFAELPQACEFESASHADAMEAFRRDVEDCALMMRHLASNVPVIAQKFGSLSRAMLTGTFDADASRKLFEALCKALPSEVFDVAVPPVEFEETIPSITTAHDHHTGLPTAASEPDLRLQLTLPRVIVPVGHGLLRTISLSRKSKAKSNTLSPRAQSPDGLNSTLPRVRARSTEAVPVERRMAVLTVDSDS